MHSKGFKLGSAFNLDPFDLTSNSDLSAFPVVAMNWPDKKTRERFEIRGFNRAYARLPEKRKFRVKSRGERPDRVVRCVESGDEYGVELTSVYLTDRSVPDDHIPSREGLPGHECLPFRREELEQYKLRLLQAIERKVRKARSGYDLSRPLILSIYINEYISIYLRQDELERWVKANESVFDGMYPFSEIVLWCLPNDGVFRVRPSP